MQITTKQLPAQLSRRARRTRVVFIGVVVCAILGGTFYAGAAAYKHEVHLQIRSAWKKYSNPNYYRAVMASEPLPKLAIDMKFDDYQQIVDHVHTALQSGKLLANSDNYLPVDLRLDGRKARGKLRLKGHYADHIDTDKWSYRIKIKSQDHFLGCRTFSIQHPKTRGFFRGWAYLQELKHEGILAAGQKFVQVSFNGENKGIYTFEEGIEKLLLEGQGRRAGVILKFENADLWSSPYTFRIEAGHVYKGLRDGWRTYDISIYQDEKVAEDPMLAKQARHAITMMRSFQEGRLPASAVFDVELMSRFLAVSELWKAHHGICWGNIRFYYNPVTGRIEPIGNDATPLVWSPRYPYFPRTEPWVQSILQDPIMAEAYGRQLVRLCQPEYMKRMRKRLSVPLLTLQRRLAKEFVPEDLEMPWHIMERQHELLQGLLDPVSPVLAHAARDDSDHQRVQTGQAAPNVGAHRKRIQVELGNRLILPIQVVGFDIPQMGFVSAADVVFTGRTQEATLSSGSAVVLPGKVIAEPLEYVRCILEVPDGQDSATRRAASGIDRSPITVVTRVLGVDRDFRTPVVYYPSSWSDDPVPQFSIAETLSGHPYLELDNDNKSIRFKPGTWRVESDLVIPAGFTLHAGPGTTLRFAEDALLLSRSALRLEGTAESPVVLEGQENRWGGIVVLSASEQSRWSHVVVRNTAGVERQGWMMTGGITFYRSAISLSHCQIVDTIAEDAINVIHAPFVFADSQFGWASSDAFDGDYTTGQIRRCVFHDIVGDGVDVSGSIVQVERSRFLHIKDKAVSAGENSQMELSELVMNDVGIGIASKDLSAVLATSIDIDQARIGLAAYIKKFEFGPAEIIAKRTTLNRVDQPAMVQTSSSILLNQVGQATTDFNTKDLYAQSILGN